MDKFARFMEKFWLVLAIGTAAWAIYMTVAHGLEQGKVWIWFPLVCIAMWWYRRFTGRKMREWAEREKDRANG